MPQVEQHLPCDAAPTRLAWDCQPSSRFLIRGRQNPFAHLVLHPEHGAVTVLPLSGDVEPHPARSHAASEELLRYLFGGQQANPLRGLRARRTEIQGLRPRLTHASRHFLEPHTALRWLVLVRAARPVLRPASGRPPETVATFQSPATRLGPPGVRAQASFSYSFLASIQDWFRPSHAPSPVDHARLAPGAVDPLRAHPEDRLARVL